MTSSVVLWWLPVGAGGHVVRHTSAWWERVEAARARRPPRPLFHAALEVTVDGARYVIEMAPEWGGPRTADRGVVRTGAVGSRFLGRSRFFRYEVRCWRDGVLPDRDWAEGGPLTLARDPAVARALLAGVPRVPALTWGRSVEGDMWNSNSLVAWALVIAGIDTADLRPPGGGRAPGWYAGLAVAREPGLARDDRPGRFRGKGRS
ncbi:hypothetical protein IU433_30660 [Nocardia puris]|uniref:Uncharacterized protein n=1 Tax=Nocardia puris TaxID=208602 RepID=A0A366CZ85_9NOCA|nr:hypothetical protein [Nocardia puris]MBF6215196.1 hypothetical protein [Nocardia puris]MBF6369754.1 hypothetical protein [Nocardia puris]MBF6463366.1 hypothetical protein [Nocardia puris]RBO82975.1 hypothetical protein DFR74_12165 [Nocardia puris]